MTPAMDMRVEDRADRILRDDLALIEGASAFGGRIGIGMRYVLVVEVLCPDDTAFAFRPAPWPPHVDHGHWRADEVVAVFLLEGGEAVRTTPVPAE